MGGIDGLQETATGTYYTTPLTVVNDVFEDFYVFVVVMVILLRKTTKTTAARAHPPTAPP